MLGVLVIILGGYRVARGRRIARQLNVLLGDMGCGSPNFHIRAVRLINPCERILILAVMVVVVVVTTPHTFVVVLTVSHGFPVHQLPIYSGSNFRQFVSDRFSSSQRQNNTSVRAHLMRGLRQQTSR
jgi:hypothetical protein